MELLALLNRLETLARQAPRVPLTGKVVLHPDDLLALVEQMRDSFPAEFQAARRIGAERDRILADAREQAEQVVVEARAAAARLVEQTAVVEEARRRAEEIVEQAQAAARDLKSGAREYAEELLTRTEANLDRALEVIRRGREELQG